MPFFFNESWESRDYRRRCRQLINPQSLGLWTALSLAKRLMLLPPKLQRNSSSLSHLETWHPNGDTDAQVYRSEQSPKVSNLYTWGWEVCKGPEDQAFLKRQLLTLWRFRAPGTLVWSLHNKMQGRNSSPNTRAGWKSPSPGKCQVFSAKRDPSNCCHCGLDLCPLAGLRFSCSQGREPTSLVPNEQPMTSPSQMPWEANYSLQKNR